MKHVSLLFILLTSITSVSCFHNGIAFPKRFNSNFVPPLAPALSRCIMPNEHPLSRRADRSRTIVKLSESSPSLSPAATFYMCLLAFQFGTQPVLTRMLAPKTINRSSYVLLQEMFKMIFSLTALYAGGTLGQSLRCLSIDSWVLIAGVPAVLYVVQNYCSLVAYQNLPPVTFNVLNQTKTLSAAFFVYVLMGKPQSNLQLVSLALLSFSALVLEKVVHLPWKKKTKTGSQSIRLDERDSFISGVLPVLIASAVSGLAGALCQQTLQSGRDTFLFTIELSTFSIIFLVFSLFFTEDGKKMKQDGFFSGWSAGTLIPVTTNALGGIIVGLVTKHAGSVQKGFALIFGLIISGLIQAKAKGVTAEQVVGGILAAISLWMHASYPARMIF